MVEYFLHVLFLPKYLIYTRGIIVNKFIKLEISTYLANIFLLYNRVFLVKNNIYEKGKHRNTRANSATPIYCSHRYGLNTNF